MSRARAALAARTTVESLLDAARKAYGKELGSESDTFDDFFDAVSFCRPLTEELGGDAGSDGWYLWKHGEWAILGDLGVLLQRNAAALSTLSSLLGTEIIVAAIDTYDEYAHFAAYEDGAMARRLQLEEDVILVEGIPVEAERGRHLDDFTLEEAERLWTSYSLPTFEFDPQDGSFRCQQVTVKKG